MQIKKSKLETLQGALKGTEGVLNLKEARIRDAFSKQLNEFVETFVLDREKIYQKFCLKKEDGSYDLKNGNQYQFNTSDLEEINAELKVLFDEEVELNLTKEIKDILDKTEYKPKIGEVEILDEILTNI